MNTTGKHNQLIQLQVGMIKNQGVIIIKALGIARRIDKLGRVVLPIELRNTLDLKIGDALEIYTEGKNVILTKYERGCIFCGEASGIIDYKGKNICTSCLKELSK